MNSKFFTPLFAAMVFIFGSAVSANAEDVLLNSSTVRAKSSHVRLIRTNMTPKKVMLQLPVEMERTVCAEYGMHLVSGYNAARCGYDSRVRPVCRMEQVCHINHRTGRRECQTIRRCFNEVYRTVRYCSWEESYCVRDRIETSTELREITLKFKGMSKLSGDEQEVFELQAQQRNVDAQRAIYDVKTIATQGSVEVKSRAATIIFKGN